MIYYGTDVTETIYMHRDNNMQDMHFVELTKSGDEPVFYVKACCNPDWSWKFFMDNVSNYEMVKHTVMDTMFECDDMNEVIEELDVQFEEIFNDIVVWDECEGNCCENCNHRDCLN